MTNSRPMPSFTSAGCNIDLQYLFGSDFLAAPILTRSNLRWVYLPAGEWYDYWTKTKIKGGCWIEVETPLDVLPLWVKSGAIIPMGPEMEYVNQFPLDPLTLTIYGPSESGETTVFDEDQPEIQVRYSRSGEELTLEVSPTPGQVEVIMYGVNVSLITSNLPSMEISPEPGIDIISFDGRKGASIEVVLK
jgi:alpha-glucosidase (family GH31 glycosyl hydrolase)